MSERLVLRGGALAGHPGPTALAVQDGRIAFVGSDDAVWSFLGDGEGSPTVVDLDGALVAPAFVDAHVHTVRTGFALTGLDLTDRPGLTAVLDDLAAHAAAHPGPAVVVGQGWDETAWPERRPPTGAELERAAPGRRTYLTRVDGHSSVVSPALAALVPGLADLPGWSAEGRVERDAHHAVRHVLETLIGDDERLVAARAACAAMAAQGIGAFHENAAPHIGPRSEVPLVRQAAAESGLHAVVYWGELMALDTARELGAAGLAGDLIADGALGSRTAALTAPYADAPGCGHGYVSAEQVHEHVVACTLAGLQAGFHAIGDAALDAVTTGFERAAAELGERWRPGHRLEHVEMPSEHTLEVLGFLGVVASVQPMFDALWGGPGGMYADRLGARWADTNPFARLAPRLAFGSDSPVTALGPWAAVRAAVHHHNPQHALSPGEAFAAHTTGGWAAGGDPTSHGLAVGDPADLALWHVPTGLDETRLPRLEADGPLPTLVRLLAAGRPIHEGEPR